MRSGEGSVEEYQVVIEGSEIRRAIADLGRELSGMYRGKRPVIIPLLRGAFVFAADLVRAMDTELQVEFIGAVSYGAKTESSGEVRLTLDTNLPLAGRHVILVEDIVDTGLTLAYIQRLLRSRDPASLLTVVMLDKRDRRVVEVEVDRSLFDIPDRFVFGYGLDSPGGFHRNLPDVVALGDEAGSATGPADDGKADEG